jgi:hypothetical protein
VRIPPGTDELTLLYHDLGDNVMEISGEAISAGLPAQTLEVDLGAPFETCDASYANVESWHSTATVLVSSSESEPGCPTTSDEVTIIFAGDASSANSIAFTSGEQVAAEFVTGGDSMRLGLIDVDAALINGNDCAVVMPPPPGAFVPQGSVFVFVLSAEARAGCGTQGVPVEFYFQGRLLEPTVPWMAGRPQEVPALTPAEVDPTETPTADQGVTSPSTGTDSMKDAQSDTSWIVTAVLMIVVGGLALGVRRQASRK